MWRSEWANGWVGMMGPVDADGCGGRADGGASGAGGDALVGEDRADGITGCGGVECGCGGGGAGLSPGKAGLSSLKSG
jgi:hypothetical protein